MRSGGCSTPAAIDQVTSDHVGWARELKDVPDIFAARSGVPGLETTLPLLYSEGVVRRGLPLGTLLHVLSEGPAARYGLAPQKGAIALGADADLVIFAPGERWRIDERELVCHAGWSPYHGRDVTGSREAGPRARRHRLRRRRGARAGRLRARRASRSRAGGSLVAISADRQIKAQRGGELRCKGWRQETILRMLENNLENAERPEELIVYAGSAKAARDWESFDRIVQRAQDDGGGPDARRAVGKARRRLHDAPALADRRDRERQPRRPLGDHGRLPGADRRRASRCTAA